MALMSDEQKMIRALNNTVNELRGQLRERQSEIEALTIDIKVLEDELVRFRRMDVTQR